VLIWYSLVPTRCCKASYSQNCAGYFEAEYKEEDSSTFIPTMYEYSRFLCGLPYVCTLPVSRLFRGFPLYCSVCEYWHPTQQLSKYSLYLTADLCQTQWRTLQQYVTSFNSGENPYDIVQSDRLVPTFCSMQSRCYAMTRDGWIYQGRFWATVRSTRSHETNKRTPIGRQQILNNARVGLQQWKSCVFYVVHAERL
jgi:hypothetical protein